MLCRFMLLVFKLETTQQDNGNTPGNLREGPTRFSGERFLTSGTRRAPCFPAELAASRVSSRNRRITGLTLCWVRPGGAAQGDCAYTALKRGVVCRARLRIYSADFDVCRHCPSYAHFLRATGHAKHVYSWRAAYRLGQVMLAMCHRLDGQ